MHVENRQANSHAVCTVRQALSLTVVLCTVQSSRNLPPWALVRAISACQLGMSLASGTLMICDTMVPSCGGHELRSAQEESPSEWPRTSLGWGRVPRGESHEPPLSTTWCIEASRQTARMCSTSQSPLDQEWLSHDWFPERKRCR